MRVDFDKRVEITDWVSGVVLKTLPVDRALLLMLRSFRFDHDHLTANVRVLHPEDAEKYNISPMQAVIFNQLR